jgi:molybdenum cofactor biosynthesis enzyme
MKKLCHVDDGGKARMVDVSGKAETQREAVARGFV